MEMRVLHILCKLRVIEILPLWATTFALIKRKSHHGFISVNFLLGITFLQDEILEAVYLTIPTWDYAINMLPSEGEKQRQGACFQI